MLREAILETAARRIQASRGGHRMRYATIDTQADPQSNTYPSSEKQKDLTRLIVSELEAAGIAPRFGRRGVVPCRGAG